MLSILAISENLRTGDLTGWYSVFDDKGYVGHDKNYRFTGLVFDSDTGIVYVGQIYQNHLDFTVCKITANYFNKDGKLCRFENSRIVPIT